MKYKCQNLAMALPLLMLPFFSCKRELHKIPSGAISVSADDLAAIRSKPNIVIIIADDLGREVPTYNGGESYSTPAMDFMAANGKQFPFFFSHPDGPPSRLAMVTGRYNFRNWVEFGELPATEKTFANLLKTAGYNTCFTGKWQFDGGDSNIVNHGFDKYRVFMPFEPDNNNGHDQFYRRYKNPYLYEAAHYLSEAEVEGKYSEDMFYEYASNFIDSNLTTPFLLVYSHNLLQKPWVPTPDDAEFATWNPATDDNTKFDRKYFSSMVAYMDKTIGKLITKVQEAGLENNTIFMLVSDNATHKSIESRYKGTAVSGAKDSTTFNGINVPFIVYAPGRVVAGTDTSLVDMTDFFPTIADIARIKTTAWQPLDGTTFYDNLTGVITKQRTSVYCYWPRFYQRKPDLSYVMDYNYKLYDSVNGSGFYRYRTDIYEKNPVPDSGLTAAEKKKKNRFSQILTSVPPL